MSLNKRLQLAKLAQASAQISPQVGDRTPHSYRPRTPRLLPLLLVSLLVTSPRAQAFSAGIAAGGIIGGVIGLMVMAHWIHAQHDRAAGVHDLDIDTEYGPAAKRYMRAQVQAEREHHRRQHLNHHREQDAHRQKRLERRRRFYQPNGDGREMHPRADRRAELESD